LLRATPLHKEKLILTLNVNHRLPDCLPAGGPEARLASGVRVFECASPNDKLAHFAGDKFEKGLKWEEMVHRTLLAARGRKQFYNLSQTHHWG